MREDKKKRRPRAIELADEDLLIQWQDGHRSRLSLEALRRECPCAACGEHRGVPEPPDTGMELPMLNADAAAATARTATGFEYVGRYGIRISWADGHDTGIYIFERLRQFDAS